MNVLSILPTRPTLRKFQTPYNNFREFVSAVYAPNDIVNVRCIRNGFAKNTWHSGAELTGQYAKLVSLNSDGWNVYAGINPRRAFGAKGDSEAASSKFLFADYDGNASAVEALSRIKLVGLPAPTIILNSGHGVHTYWLLNSPMTDLAKWTAIMKAAAAALKSDPKICNAERIMRLPGCVNWKDPIADCRLLECDPTRIYTLDQITSVIPTPLPSSNSPACPSIYPKRVYTVRGDIYIYIKNNALQIYCVNLLNENREKVEKDREEEYDPEDNGVVPRRACNKVREAIERTIPRRSGTRERQLGKFAQALRSVPGFRFEDDPPEKKVRTAVGWWHHAAMFYASTQDFGTTWREFIGYWGKGATTIRAGPAGRNVKASAINHAS